MTLSYEASSRLNKNDFVTDPTIPDPENLPEPLGWNILVRPYPIKTETRKGGIILASESIDYMQHVVNIGRVVSVGPCCWSQAHHKNRDGERFDWVKEGDFVSYPRNTGARRKFKGVSFVLLADDEIVERLPDPRIFDSEDAMLDINIPEEDLRKYNTIHNPDYKG